MFRALRNRLHDSTWTVVLKSLITIHLMIREGQPDATLAYLSKHRNLIAISSFTDGRLAYLRWPFWCRTSRARGIGHHFKDAFLTNLSFLRHTAQIQGRNIRHYASYIAERVRAYRDTKCDWVRVKEGRLEKMTVEKGLLRETEVVQNQLTALLKCDVRIYQARLSRPLPD